jgi:hypothetical protein
VAIRYTGDNASANVLLGAEWCVRPSQDLIERLGQLIGREGVELVYGVPGTGGTGQGTVDG